MFIVQLDEWWKMLGGVVPKLKSFSEIILNQTSSSSGCERNWSVFKESTPKERTA